MMILKLDPRPELTSIHGNDDLGRDGAIHSLNKNRNERRKKKTRKRRSSRLAIMCYLT